jgi:hypothetical protein
MQTVIKVVKRGSKDNKDAGEAAAPKEPQLTTEMIVKSWIIESREHRHATMSQLQTSIGWTEFGGLHG